MNPTPNHIQIDEVAVMQERNLQTCTDPTLMNTSGIVYLDSLGQNELQLIPTDLTSWTIGDRELRRELTEGADSNRVLR